MRRTTWVIALVLATGVLTAAGCGGDDNSSSGGSGTSSGGGGETLTVTADPSGQISWDKSELSAKAGKVTLKIVNESSVPHAIEVEGNGVEDKTDTVTGGNGEVTVDLKAGKYEYYCPVGDHRKTMKGELTVQ
jgi:plastocyanin